MILRSSVGRSEHVEEEDRRRRGNTAVHLTLCVHADGTVEFFPEGDPSRLAEALKTLVAAFQDHPERIACAVGACVGHSHHDE